MRKDIAKANELAATLDAGASYEDDLFGTVTLVGLDKGPDEWDGGGLDLYRVKHSGFQHAWSSTVVAAAFGLVKW